MSQGAGSIWKLQKAGTYFSLELQREQGPADTVILAQWALFWTSDLQTRETISLCTYMVMCYVATGNSYTPHVMGEKTWIQEGSVTHCLHFL